MRGERRGDFQNHLLCCHLFKIPNCFPVLKGVFSAFTQPVNLLIFTRQRSFSVHKQQFCPALWDFLGFKASLVFIFLKFLLFSVLFAPFRTLCMAEACPQPYFCKPKDQRGKKSWVNSSVIAAISPLSCFSSHALLCKFGVNYNRDKMVSKCLRVMESESNCSYKKVSV